MIDFSAVKMFEGCGCTRCCNDRFNALPEAERTLEGQISAGLMTFQVCATCGNKRCPKATDHRLDCTNSNEPGQKGSRYE